MCSSSVTEISEHCLLGLRKRLGVDLPQVLGLGAVRLGGLRGGWRRLPAPRYVKGGKAKAFACVKGQAEAWMKTRHHSQMCCRGMTPGSQTWTQGWSHPHAIAGKNCPPRFSAVHKFLFLHVIYWKVIAPVSCCLRRSKKGKLRVTLALVKERLEGAIGIRGIQLWLRQLLHFFSSKSFLVTFERFCRNL